MIDLDLIRCRPAGAVSTALDVNLDQPGKRSCGMCQRDVSLCRLHEICPHCGHLLAYFQLLTDVTAIGDHVSSEKALAAYQKRYQRQQHKNNLRFDPYGDPGE